MEQLKCLQRVFNDMESVQVITKNWQKNRCKIKQDIKLNGISLQIFLKVSRENVVKGTTSKC